MSLDSQPPFRLGSPFQGSPRLRSEALRPGRPLFSPRLQSEPYRRHYHVKRQGSPSDSPIKSMKSTTDMLRRLNHKKNPFDAMLNEASNGMSPLGFSSVEGLSKDFSKIRMSTPLVARAATQGVSHKSIQTEETSPLACPHGFSQVKPDLPATSPSDICPHGFRRAKVDVCPHGVLRGGMPETALHVCPHGFMRAKVEVCPHGITRNHYY
ncbi:hypothetical protein B0H12DRAFT_1079423 [Mycena haematopus]|nr:hypothetical protein B0H12DRAFT_1079423 [Mycena haematopus]